MFSFLRIEHANGSACNIYNKGLLLLVGNSKIFISKSVHHY